MEKNKTQKKQLRISHQVIFSSIKTRKELIRLVTCEKLSVKFAHSRLGINYSTAKMIVRKYKQSGKITQFRRERTNKLQESTSQDSINGSYSENKSPSPKSEQDNFNYSQHIQPIQFPIFMVPQQDFGQSLDYYNIGSQHFCLPSMFYTYQVPNYFSL